MTIERWTSSGCIRQSHLVSTFVRYKTYILCIYFSTRKSTFVLPKVSRLTFFPYIFYELWNWNRRTIHKKYKYLHASMQTKQKKKWHFFLATLIIKNWIWEEKKKTINDNYKNKSRKSSHISEIMEWLRSLVTFTIHKYTCILYIFFLLCFPRVLDS